MKYIEKKSWNSLTQLKKWLEENTKEKIKYFDGIILKTNKYSYTMAFGKVEWTKLK
jgi:hypothetical protein